jgi:hypothetical protein
MSSNTNPKLIGPRLKNRYFYSQRHYDLNYQEKHGPRVYTEEQKNRSNGRLNSWHAIHKDEPEYKFYKRVQKYRLVRKFTLADYIAMLVDQNNSCKICSRKFDELLIPMIDHDHLEHKVRSLLCNDCNSGLGFFKESEELMLKAIEYLKAHHPDRFSEGHL